MKVFPATVIAVTDGIGEQLGLKIVECIYLGRSISAILINQCYTETIPLPKSTVMILEGVGGNTENRAAFSTSVGTVFDPTDGVVTGKAICAYTNLPHADFSQVVRAKKTLE
jgi:hypothetical protein